MLFGTYEFLLLFLPAVWVVYRVVPGGGRARLVWLLVSSLVFYGYREPLHVALLVGSAGVNYVLGRGFVGPARAGSRAAVALGIVLNLGALAYFKYTGFAAAMANDLFGAGLSAPAVVMPLAISFFTFQQIAYLVDLHRGEASSRNPLEYVVSVVFFPKLLSGPIVRDHEMDAGFAAANTRPGAREGARGITLLAIGLFKKLLIADALAPTVSRVFSAAEKGQIPGAADAWLGALSYTMQLYFDFSGYVDMALGLGLLFGFSLPLNFDSPYKATSPSDFWRRWHITLSRFLRDYLYIPLGGNRRGERRRTANLMITMTLAGLWHGAGWTFVLWGAAHGAMLAVNHLWSGLWRRLPGRAPGVAQALATRGAARVLTFVAVVLAWVLFRAQTVGGAVAVWRGMLGFGGWGMTGAPGWLAEGAHVWDLAIAPFHALSGAYGSWAAIGVLMVVTMALPNSNRIAAGLKPSVRHAVPVAAALLLATWRILAQGSATEFLYFDF
ncbi:MAG: MBOAT family protein [Deltaproteobacteria bacterium]|nr:MBOAT family protein [Deltaproteobacteria bacterium]